MQARRNVRRAVALSCGLIVSAPSSLNAKGIADGFCDDLFRVIGASSTDPQSTPLNLSSLAAFDGRAQCGLSKTVTGAIAHHCGATYPYRSLIASQDFAALSTAMEECRFTTGRVEDAGAVNHPDSYDQRSFLSGGANGIWRVDLSLKDKATLEKTYLFLRVWKTDQ